MSTVKNNIEQQLRQYLIANGLRQTKERYAILQAVYSIEGTFSIEELQTMMQQRRLPVSMSTLYATTQLLVQANLLVQHPFSTSLTLFESITDNRPRCYQICNTCHHITRIKNKELLLGIDAYRPRSFSIRHRILYVYGICGRCERQLRKKRAN